MTSPMAAFAAGAPEPTPEVWLAEGGKLFAQTLDALDDDQFAEPSGLPGWTRAHLVAHVASNARAMGNLIHWAATGEETPAYSSEQQRETEIAEGARLSPAELRQLYAESARHLSRQMAQLTPQQWEFLVTNRQGEQMPVRQVVWMRARELMVHAVDLAAGVSFADLPPTFVTALVDDIVKRRSARGDGPAVVLRAMDTGEGWPIRGEGEPAQVQGRLAEIAAWLAGRPAQVRNPLGELPELPAWL